MAKASYGIVSILGILQVNSYDLSTGTDFISNNSNSTSLQSALFKHMYVVVIFLSQVIYIFPLFQRHYHTLPYPKAKEKQKLPEIKKINYNMYFGLK